jgi:hypothetical protein
MARYASIHLFLSVILTAAASAATHLTLDDFLASSDRLNDVRTMATIILSQVDPGAAEHNATELRRSYWAARPDSGLGAGEVEAELAKFDLAWKELATVVRNRKISSLALAGIDLVLLTRAQDWYFAAVTPRGPVLIVVSVQFYPDAPMTLHGVKVLTEWESIKRAAQNIHLPAGKAVVNITYQPEKLDRPQDPRPRPPAELQ